MNNIINFIPRLCLSARLNTPQLAADYFGVSLKTWKRWVKANKLKSCYVDALKARSGYITAPGWSGYQVRDNFIYAPNGEFIARHEIDGMWLYRQIKQFNDAPPALQFSLF